MRRRFLGIAARNEAFDVELAGQVGRPKGVRVIEINRGSPAANGGLEPDDLLLDINGTPISTIDDLQRQMALDPSDDIMLALWRRGARTQRKPPEADYGWVSSVGGGVVLCRAAGVASRPFAAM